MKRFVSILCCLSLLLGMIVTPVCAADEIETGRLGDNITYTFNRTRGHLQVQGYGPMWDFVPGDISSMIEDGTNQWFIGWNKAGEVSPLMGDPDIRHIEISDEITRIGSCAFFYCTGLLDVTLGKDVCEVGKLAFAGASKLKAVMFPEGMRLLEERCFTSCDALGCIYFLGDAPVLRWETLEIPMGQSKNVGPFDHDLIDVEPVLFYTPEAFGWPMSMPLYHEYEQRVMRYKDISIENPGQFFTVSWEGNPFQGTGAQKFMPERIATRAEFLTAIYRIKGTDTPYKQGGFPDVADGLWYSDAVCWAVNDGVVFGYPDGTFRPDQPITRQEAAVIMYRCRADENEVDVEKIKEGMADFDRISSFAREAMCWAQAEFLLYGINDQYALRFAPNDTMTREEMAYILAHSF